MNGDRRKIVQALPLVALGGVMGNQAARSHQEKQPASSKKVVAGGSPNFSRTVEFQRLLFVSGVLGVEPQSRKLASAEFEGQARQGLTNLKDSVEAGGSKMIQVLKCTCFLVEAGDFEVMNKVYREFFPQDPPARSTIVVKELVLTGAKFEIECIAHT